jgi:hypothetical protein
MKVKVIGIQASATQGAVLRTLLDRLQAEKPVKYWDNVRTLYSTPVGKGDYAGLIITDKDHKSVPSAEELDTPKGGKRKKRFRKVTLRGKQRFIDFTYFVIKPSGEGLMTFYPASCSVAALDRILNLLLPEEKRGQLQIEPMLMREDFDTLLKELQSPNRSVFSFKALGEREGLLRACSLVSDRISLEFHHFDGATDSKIKTAIRDTAKALRSAGSLLGLRVHGRDSEDEPMVIRLTNNPPSFTNYDFDEIIDGMEDSDVDDLSTSPMVQELLDLCVANGLK